MAIGTMLVLGQSNVAARADNVALGEFLSGECVTCHRRDGQDKGIPAIVGWPPDQFTATLQAYKTQRRGNITMQTIAARLSDEDIRALAAYFARKTSP